MKIQQYDCDSKFWVARGLCGDRDMSSYLYLYY